MKPIGWRARATGFGAGLVTFAGLYAAARLRPGVLSGDPFAVYFPVVQALFAGDGLLGLAPLRTGSLRMPGYPFLLSLISLLVPDLIRSAQLLGAGIAALTVAGLERLLGALGVTLPLRLAAIFAVAVTPTFVRAALEPLPDALAAALVVWGLVFALGPRRERAWFWSSLLFGLAFSVRANFLLILPAVWFGWRGFEPRRVWIASAGFLLGAAPFLLVVVGLNLSGLSYPFFSLSASQQIGGADGPIERVVASLLDQPRRLAAASGWVWLVSALVLGLWQRRRLPAGLLVRALVFGLGPLVLMHFEARYYLLAALLLPVLVAIWGQAAVGTNLGARGLALGFVLWASFALWEVRDFLERDAASIARIAAQCAELSRLEPGPDRVRIVGLAGAQARYSALGMCPRPLRVPPQGRVRLVSAASVDPGLDAVLTASTGALLRSAPERLPGPAGPQFAEETLLLELPKRERDRCTTRRFESAPSGGQIRLVFAGDPKLVAVAEIASGSGRRRQFAAGTATGSFALEGAGALLVSLCAADETQRGRLQLRASLFAPPLE